MSENYFLFLRRSNAIIPPNATLIVPKIPANGIATPVSTPLSSFLESSFASVFSSSYLPSFLSSTAFTLTNTSAF